MAQRRKRSSRGGGSSLSWLWLAALVLIGLGVLAARTLGRQDATEAVATATSVPATRAAAAPARTPTATSQPAEERHLDLATPTATRVRAAATATAVRATPTPQAKATAAAGATATATVTAAPARAAPPTIATTVVIQAASTPTSTSAPAQRGANGVLALTFDAGADRGYAQDILDRLAEEHVLASFGITGNWAKANPDLVRRMAADGHMVFNHTLDHRSFTGVSDSMGGLSAAARRSELDQADAIIAPLIGHTTKPFYRLPYGDDDARVAADVAPDGYTQKVGWTVDSLGWRGAPLQDIVARCVRLAAPDAVYVLHVGRASQDANALPEIITTLRARGFSFARVDQL